MRPRHLEVFHAVAAHGSVTEAAKRLHVSQPAVSKYLRELEQDLGYALRVRQGNSWRLTTEGRLLFEEIAKSLVGFDRLSQFAVDLKAMRVGRLAVACLPLLAIEPLSSLISDFLEVHPEIALSLLVLNSHGVIDQVIAGKADVGIGLHLPFHEEVESRLVARMRLVCMLDRDDPLAVKDTITAADLHGRRLITIGTGDAVQLEIDRLFRAEGVRASRRVETLTSHSVLRLAEHGLGIALLDDFVASQYRGTRLVKRAFQPEILYALAVITSRDRPLSRLARSFVDHLVGRLPRVLPEIAQVRP
ncbi:LysR family transcriptional regulator [Rhodoligotrophos ferricapiens]|uniref:LysR family transcriptional regulator n=1 Tax=Rhodoligotrophos ferricapiens TaxID=3069264 RepID=UPI00315CCA18